MNKINATIRVPSSRQGQPGRGQGGWASYAFVQAIGQPATVALRSPVPVETDLAIVEEEERWLLVNPSAGDVVVMEASRWEPNFPTTSPVEFEQAEAARRTFGVRRVDHPAPQCVSCGFGPESLRVHPGPIGDGRWATPWRAPAAPHGSGAVDEGLLWMGMDCSSAWYVSLDGAEPRNAVTVQLAVDVHDDLQPDTDYVLVAWSGDHPPRWDGRKRGAASALFDPDGRCVASSRSFWIATP